MAFSSLATIPEGRRSSSTPSRSPTRAWRTSSSVFQTDEAGSYLEIPLIAASDDSAAVATVNSTVSWLMSEKTRVGMAVGAKFAASSEDASSTIAPQDLTTWKDGLQCMADLAVLGLTITDPVAFFASEAAVDGTFAVISAVSGTGGTGNDVGGAVTNATLLGVAKGVGKAVTNAVSHGAIGADTVSALKAGGGALAAVGVAGAVGYQIYKNGVGAGLQTAINAVVPQACVSAYQNFTQVPNVTVTPTSGACMSESDCTGSLPSGTQTCADGSSAGASWLCNSGVCVIAYCASEGGTAGSSSDPSDAGAPGSEGGASSSDSGEPSYESGDAG
jgi:hypothetical protein